MAVVLPITTFIEGITHTSLLNESLNIDASCANIVNVPGASLLNLRIMNARSQVTTLNGRQTGIRVDLTKYSFSQYQMRRKAETLQYRKNQYGLSKKKQYSQMSTIGNSYSYQSLINRLQNNNCPNSYNPDVIVKPPTNSGVRDYKFSGYYYDKSVPYLPSL